MTGKRKIIAYSILWFCILSLNTEPCIAQAANNYTYAERVFNTLVKTINQSSPSKPKLVVVPDANLIAKTFPSGEIRIGYGLVEHCRTFGKDSANAIAHVLSHELTHYYSNHFWTENFGTAYADSEWGETIARSGNDTSMLRIYETQADEYGMYYAFTAGYKTLEIGAAVLDSIYSWYHLKNKIPGYPALAERKEIAALSKKNIAALIPVFESANIFMELAQLFDGNDQATLIQLSASCYGDILDHNIRTKELLNNMAVGKIIAASQIKADINKSIHFPFMLETKSILYNSTDTRGEGGSGLQTMEDSLKQVWLEEAELACLNAIKLDRNFFAAHINLTIVYFLQEKFGSAADALTTANKMITGGSDHAWITEELEGILAFAKEDSEGMKKHLLIAKETGSITATYNLLVLQNYIAFKNNPNDIPVENFEQQTAFPVYAYITPDTTELFKNVWIGSYLHSLQVKKNNRIELQNGDAILFQDTIENYAVVDTKCRFKNASLTKIRIIKTLAHSDERTSRGLQMNLHTEELRKLYGDPDIILPESGAVVYSYARQNLLVWISDDKVEKWCYWRVM